MRSKIMYITTAAMIAAIYAALTLAGIGFAYGPVQFRFSEALNILPVFTPAAIPGLTIGCVIANLIGPYGIADVVLGSLATLLSALFAYAVRNIRVWKLPLLAPLGAVVFNAFIVSAIIFFFTPEEVAYFASVIWIGLGQLASCYGLGIPLYYILDKSKLFDRFNINN
ncbi:MAG: QueT transporter family protein [Clostridiaceae bacterium]|nr:QueT transporter family protein [Clostridiaceae bacterium]